MQPGGAVARRHSLGKFRGEKCKFARFGRIGLTWCHKKAKPLKVNSHTAL